MSRSRRACAALPWLAAVTRSRVGVAQPAGQGTYGGTERGRDREDPDRRGRAPAAGAARRRVRRGRLQVSTAKTGEEAIEVLEAAPRLDALVADIRLPGKLSGWDIAEHFRCAWPYG